MKLPWATDFGSASFGLIVPLLIISFSALIGQAQPAGFLHASNNRIVDGQGQETILRGMGPKFSSKWTP